MLNLLQKNSVYFRAIALAILVFTQAGCLSKNKDTIVASGDGGNGGGNGGGGSTVIGSGGDGMSAGFIQLGKAIAKEVQEMPASEKPVAFTEQEWAYVQEQLTIDFVEDIDVVSEPHAQALNQPRDARNECSAENPLIKIDRNRWEEYRLKIDLYPEQLRLVMHEYLLCLGLEDAPGYKYTDSLLEKLRQVRSTPAPIGAVGISSCADLQEKLNPENAVKYGYYRILTNDIYCDDAEDLNDGEGFKPILLEEGVVDGNDYTIYNLLIDHQGDILGQKSNTAIFSRICANCVVKNLNLQNIQIYGDGIRVAILAAENHGTILNVNIIGGENQVFGSPRTAFAAALAASNSGVINGSMIQAKVSVDYDVEANELPVSATGHLGVGLVAGENLIGATLNRINAQGNVRGYEFVGGAIGFDAGNHTSGIQVHANVAGWNRLGGFVGYGHQGFLSDGNSVKGSVIADLRDQDRFEGSTEIGAVLGRRSFSYMGIANVEVLDVKVIPVGGLRTNGTPSGVGIRFSPELLTPFR